MNSQPKVSVIIPAYNTEKYIEKCLSSVVSQTYPTLEILIINDASSDNTLNIIRHFADNDERIIIINNETNKGNGVGRNMAVKMATGEYIIFVDSDDYIEPTLVEKAINKALEKQVSTVIIGHYEEHRHTFRKKKIKCIELLPQISGKEKKEDIYQYFLLQHKGLFIQPWKYIVKKSLLIDNNICFDESGAYFEDIIFSTKLLFFTPDIIPIYEPLYHYVYRKKSITHSWSRKTIESRFTALLSVKQFLKEKNVFETYKDVYTLFFLRSGFLQSFFDFVRMKEKDKEVESFLSEMSKSPFIQQFNIYSLRLPAIDKNAKPKEVPYVHIQSTITLIRKCFYFSVYYTKFINKFRMLRYNIFKKTSL
jgi:glycosyltransferase involved in cell wall biosynthesis